MTKKMLDMNKSINEFLQDSYTLEKALEKKGMKEVASRVRRTSSSIAHFCITMSGLDKALKEFWNDKKALGRNDN